MLSKPGFTPRKREAFHFLQEKKQTLHVKVCTHPCRFGNCCWFVAAEHVTSHWAVRNACWQWQERQCLLQQCSYVHVHKRAWKTKKWGKTLKDTPFTQHHRYIKAYYVQSTGHDVLNVPRCMSHRLWPWGAYNSDGKMVVTSLIHRMCLAEAEVAGNDSDLVSNTGHWRIRRRLYVQHCNRGRHLWPQSKERKKARKWRAREQSGDFLQWYCQEIWLCMREKKRKEPSGMKSTLPSTVCLVLH